MSHWLPLKEKKCEVSEQSFLINNLSSSRDYGGQVIFYSFSYYSIMFCSSSLYILLKRWNYRDSNELAKIGPNTKTSRYIKISRLFWWADSTNKRPNAFVHRFPNRKQTKSFLLSHRRCCQSTSCILYLKCLGGALNSLSMPDFAQQLFVLIAVCYRQIVSTSIFMTETPWIDRLYEWRWKMSSKYDTFFSLLNITSKEKYLRPRNGQ